VVGVGALWIDMNEFDPANSRCRTRMGVNHSRVPSFMMFRTHGRRHSNQTDSQRANRAYAVTTNGESIARSIHTAAVPDRAALIGAQEVLGGTP
jgi:hypothetical protein